MIENLMTLGVLILLQAVLGLDNLLYVSLESKRVPKQNQQRVRRLGIGIAIALRIVLLFVLISVIKKFQTPFFSVDVAGVWECAFNLHALIVLVGGGFIIYTAMKEIVHMMGVHDLENEEAKPRSVNQAITAIVIMNIVFSIDSILSAMALTNTFWVMATAIVIGGILMIVLADHVAAFLQKNRLYEVLGLFILFVVGIMLVSEGAHLAHLKIGGHVIHAMSKSTFYFVIAVLVLCDVVQSRYQKRILAERAAKSKAVETHAETDASSAAGRG